MAYQAATKQYRTRSLWRMDEPITYEFDEDGVTYSDSASSGQFRWTIVTHLERKPYHWRIKLRGYGSIVLPLEALDANIQQFILHKLSTSQDSQSALEH